MKKNMILVFDKKFYIEKPGSIRDLKCRPKIKEKLEELSLVYNIDILTKHDTGDVRWFFINNGINRYIDCIYSIPGFDCVGYLIDPKEW